jgi:hypothetical protein
LILIKNSQIEENIVNRNNYLRTGKIFCDILTPEPLKESYLLELEGLFYNENKWEKRIIEYKIYPNEEVLHSYHKLKELDFYGDTSFEISLRIKGQLYGPFLSKPHNKFNNLIKFKFSGWEDIYNDIKNKYLSTDNNKKVINLSIEEDITIISSIGNLNCAKYSYITHDLEHCRNLFMW